MSKFHVCAKNIKRYTIELDESKKKYHIKRAFDEWDGPFYIDYCPFCGVKLE